MKRYYHDIKIAAEAISTNKLKSVLTALGIIFGVAAVISMLAIGNGAKQEIIQQMKLVGVNNIIVKPLESNSENSEESEEEGKRQNKKFSKGLSLSDAYSIKKHIPNVLKVSPEIVLETSAIQNGIKKNIKLIGVDADYFDIFNLEIEEGKVFENFHNENTMSVCIIGDEIRKKFFKNTNPLGKSIKCGIVWLRIIGIISNKTFMGNSSDNLGISNSNEQIYIPSRTMVLRFKNKSLVTSNLLQKKNSRQGGMRNSGGSQKNNESANHQIDKIIIHTSETEFMESTRDAVERMLLRKHSDVKDFEIIIPELLLKQQQRTKDIFNIVLGAIASISLIVGGIGIMNIMLASVMERIKEIGTRLAIGATKRDIIVQFLSESTLISIVGGIIGVILGIVFSKLITHFAEIQTIVTLSSVAIAFGISATVGIIFGYMPARRAAEKDPVESLRYE